MKDPGQPTAGQGFPPGDKGAYVQDIFTRVAPAYDKMNDAMSLFQHRVWKNRFVSMLPQPTPSVSQKRGSLSSSPQDFRYIDVSTGSGDIPLRLLSRLQSRGILSRKLPQGRAEGDVVPTPELDITLVDPNRAMLDMAKNRLTDRGHVQGLTYLEAPAECLPLSDDGYHVYTISFGLRNVSDRRQALAEAHRVLKPQGWFYCLEFSHPIWPGFDKLYDIYSFGVIPKLGKWLAQDEPAYQYLVESIRRFPKQATLIQEMTMVGFKNTRYVNMAGGIVAVHMGQKA